MSLTRIDNNQVEIEPTGARPTGCLSAVSIVGSNLGDKHMARPTRGPYKLSRFQEACSDDLPREGWFSTQGATIGRQRAAAILERNLARRALPDYVPGPPR